MGILTLYDVLRDIVFNLSAGNRSLSPWPEKMEPEARLSKLGLDSDCLPEVLKELKSRLDGRDVNVLAGLDRDQIAAMSLREFLLALQKSILNAAHSPITVYVDDEEENLFVFKRRFGKELNLATFTDPEAAFAFIRSESSVRLVITDEVMPGLTGSALCNAVRRVKPFLKFVLITGNPNGDQDLMYDSLRHGKFQDFLSKPLDLDKYGAEYLSLFRALISGEDGRLSNSLI